MSLGRLGFRILPSPAPCDADLLRHFKNASSAAIADAMGRFGFMDPGIESRTGLPFCACAVTVRCRPGDNLMLHKAIEVAREGEAIVVDTCGSRTTAVFGELMGRTATARGVAGLVVDGAVRDVDQLRALQLPVFSREVSPGGCDKDGPGEINVPVSCGSVVVMAGDVVVADRDGVVVVPLAHVREVIETLADVIKREEARAGEIERGQLFRPEVNELLRKRGVIE